MGNNGSKSVLGGPMGWVHKRKVMYKGGSGFDMFTFHVALIGVRELCFFATQHPVVVSICRETLGEERKRALLATANPSSKCGTA